MQDIQDIQPIQIELLANVFGGAAMPEKKCDSHGPPGLLNRDPKSTYMGAPGIVPTIGGPAVKFPTIPCRQESTVKSPSLKDPGAAPVISPKPGSW